MSEIPSNQARVLRTIYELIYQGWPSWSLLGRPIGDVDRTDARAVAVALNGAIEGDEPDRVTSLESVPREVVNALYFTECADVWLAALRALEVRGYVKATRSWNLRSVALRCPEGKRLIAVAQFINLEPADEQWNWSVFYAGRPGPHYRFHLKRDEPPIHYTLTASGIEAAESLSGDDGPWYPAKYYYDEWDLAQDTLRSAAHRNQIRARKVPGTSLNEYHDGDVRRRFPQRFATRA